jgi:hypothetical protein
MRAVKISLAACGVSTACLAILIANAIFAPMPAKAPQAQPSGWTTVVYKTAF